LKESLYKVSAGHQVPGFSDSGSIIEDNIEFRVLALKGRINPFQQPCFGLGFLDDHGGLLIWKLGFEGLKVELSKGCYRL